MTDDNQKFLDKFKDQISKMGKDGILGTDNDISSISNLNNNNKYTNIIIKNSLTDKNIIKKGSAFLKPINKPKINCHNNSNININNQEQSKNNPNDNENKILENNHINKNKYNIINNPYITNNNSNLFKPNEIINFPIMPYYQYPYPSQNSYYYYNNINNMNNPQGVIFPPPYQLYYNSNPYIQNNNQNIPNNNINDNNINKSENNNKIKSKKKLRPISAQMVGRAKSFMNNTNTTINSNYANNITTYNNSKYEYKPYTLKDYKEIINVDTLGGLGANIGTEEWEKKKEKMDKMLEYSKNIFKKSKNNNKNKDNQYINKLDNLIAKNKQKKDALSTRKRANEYSKLIRPKSSGQYKIIRYNEQNRNNNIKFMNKKNNKFIYEENNEDKVNNINNMNIIQGKYALLHHNKLNDEKNINNINYIKNIDNSNETNNNKIKCKRELKDIFGEISDEEDEEEKKLQEYYNKFKIDTDYIINDKEYGKLEIKKEKDNEINEDSLEAINDNNNNDNIINDKLKDNEIEVINNNNINLIKKYKTFKEQRNAVNNKNNSINKKEIKINKDNNISNENNDNNDKELDLQTLLAKREKYLKEIEEIKKGL